jgi:hypothetical protein
MTFCDMWGYFRGERSGSACFAGPLGKTSQLSNDAFHIGGTTAIIVPCLKSHVPIDCTFAASQLEISWTQKFNIQEATYYELHICLVTKKYSREMLVRKSTNFSGFSFCLTMLRSCASLRGPSCRMTRCQLSFHLLQRAPLTLRCL